MKPVQELTPADVQAELDRLGVDTQIQFFENSTATSQQAADNIGCELGQIVKSIAFIVDGTPIVVLTSGDQRVDDRKIATIRGVGRKQVKIATPEQLVEIYGYAPGAMPPLPYRTPNIPVYLDDTLSRFDIVYAAGGAHNAIFPIELAKLTEITGAQVLNVVKD
jgi:prolyl-tRNA editing enzyme YbaK/EbsC (Cys-tRNA(Pro) deacylase)